MSRGGIEQIGGAVNGAVERAVGGYARPSNGGERPSSGALAAGAMAAQQRQEAVRGLALLEAQARVAYQRGDKRRGNIESLRLVAEMAACLRTLVKGMG